MLMWMMPALSFKTIEVRTCMKSISRRDAVTEYRQAAQIEAKAPDSLQRKDMVYGASYLKQEVTGFEGSLTPSFL